MQKLNQKYINSVVKQALMEDLNPKGDVTTGLLKFKNKTIRDFITYSDGRNTLEDIAKLIGISFVESKRLFLKLKKMNLVN